MDLTHKQTAYALLRIAFGINFLMHGAIRLYSGLGAFASSTAEHLAKSPLPHGFVLGFGYAIPFLEVLLAAVCKSIPIRRNESFVDQVRRWTEALAAMTALQPNTRYEWYLAADVAMKQLIALHSLALYQRKGVTGKAKQKHGLDFISQTKAMQDALLRYDLSRKRDMT